MFPWGGLALNTLLILDKNSKTRPAKGLKVGVLTTREKGHRVEGVEQGHLSIAMDFLAGIISIASDSSHNNRYCRPYKLLS
jgi:hypothetical protein